MERFLRARPVWQEFFPTTKINLVIVSFWTYKRISAFVSPTLLACIGSSSCLFTNVITRAYLHLSKKFHLACKGSSRSIVPKLWNLATLWFKLLGYLAWIRPMTRSLRKSTECLTTAKGTRNCKKMYLD